jgi:secreted PhoX family phosphatase
MLPAGFSSRLIARGGAPVEGTTYTWHPFSDGMGTFALADGGWLLASNSEVPGLPQGGASALRFDRDGAVTDGYRILRGTTMNCAGGVTPWGTWLSCEEVASGQVWECDPTGEREAVARPALGVFSHEAVAVDPGDGRLYLTEDTADAGWYRFTPARAGDLSAGALEIAVVDDDGRVTWAAVPDPAGASAPTRLQVGGSARFQRGEGTWFDSGVVYFCTTSDHRVYAYDVAAQTLEIVYDGGALGGTPEITDVDNVTVAAKSGDIYVCEDIGDGDQDEGLDVGIVSREREVTRFLTATGSQHAGSELCGVCFDPSGTRMYVASQRAGGLGAVYEVAGPFRLDRAEGRPPDIVAGDAPSSTRAPMSFAVLGTATLRRFRRAHVTVRVDVPEAGPVTAVLVARVKRRTVTLARARRETDGPGRVKLRLRPSARIVRLLARRRRITATLTVTAAGERARRRVRLL